MRSIWKDVFAAFIMGMVLPGVILNFAVMLMRREAPIADLQITIPAETKEKTVSLPVRVRSADGTVAQRDMDEYLCCVLLAEMPVSFEEEALKAQAVAARTYAQKALITGGKHLDGSVCMVPGCCQSYIDPQVYMSQGGTAAGLEKIQNAVSATTGLCLEYEGELIEATYFSCSGGRTEDAAAVWGTDYPYLQAVDSPGEEEAAGFSDTVAFTVGAFCNALGIELTAYLECGIGSPVYTDGGGVETIEIGGERFTGTQLRSLLGLRSTAFALNTAGDSIVITTYGYGHRVGMSQYGAEAMALEGSDYRQILSYYYPGTELVSVFP
ncbi:MAG: stage II sporulation protein D [Oscillospiraceae bacterium]|nr:stage II sporulation protein D [Oscillospiraceae bacterium]